MYKTKLEAVKKHFETALREDGLVKNGGCFKAVENDSGRAVNEVIVEELDELGADYVTIYPHIQVPGSGAHGRGMGLKQRPS